LAYPGMSDDAGARRSGTVVNAGALRTIRRVCAFITDDMPRIFHVARVDAPQFNLLADKQSAME